MSNFLMPRNISKFSLKPRNEVLPKGLSPIMKEIKTLDISLSPVKKENLHKLLFENIENELSTIKWENYFQSKGDFKLLFTIKVLIDLLQIQKIFLITFIKKGIDTWNWQYPLLKCHI